MARSEVERASEHPLAVAIVKTAEARGVTTAAVPTSTLTGKGAVGVVDGRRIASKREIPGWLGVDPSPLAARRGPARGGRNRDSMAVDAAVAGALAIADPVKASTPEEVAWKAKVLVVLATIDDVRRSLGGWDRRGRS